MLFAFSAFCLAIVSWGFLLGGITACIAIPICLWAMISGISEGARSTRPKPETREDRIRFLQERSNGSSRN